MRPIKFRAWDTRYNKWAYFPLQLLAFGDAAREAEQCVDWCEFTGLKDKNGVEIYEGDIVIDSRDKTKLPREIRWYRGGFMQHKNGHFGFSNIEQYDGDSKYFEVIGNIYQNPELLDDKRSK